MEENKQTRTFPDGGDFRNGKNLLNLRGGSQTNASPIPAKAPGGAGDQAPARPHRDSSQPDSLNALDHLLEYGVYLTVFLMPIFILPFSFEVQEFNKSFLLVAMSGILLFVWTLNSVFVKGRICFFKSALTLPFGIFLLSLLLGTLFGVDRLTSLQGYYGTFSDSLIFYAALFVFYLLSLSLIAQKGPQRFVGRIIDASIYSSVLVAIVSLSYFFGLKLLPMFTTASAGFNPASGHVQVLAIYLLAIVFLALYDLYSARKLSPLGKAADALAIILAFFNLAIIGWASIFIVLFVLLAACAVFGKLFSSRNIGTAGGALASVLLVGSLAFALSGIDFSQAAKGRAALKEPSISSVLKNSLSIDGAQSPLLAGNRLSPKEAVAIASGSFKASPVLGSGVGTYYYDFSKYRSADFNYDENWSLRFGKGYNEMLEKISTLGALGVLSYLLLALSAVHLFFKNSRKDKRELPLLGAFLSLLIFQFLFLETAILKFVFVLLLIIAAGGAFTREDRKAAEAIFAKGRKTAAFAGMDGRLSGRILPIAAIAATLGCSAVLLLDVQAFRAEAKYNALNSATNVDSVDSAEIEEVTELYPYRGEYSLGLSRIYIARVNSLIPSLAAGGENINKTKHELDRTTYHVLRGKELSPNNVAMWENYGYVYRRMSDLGMENADEQAIKGFEAASRLDPNNAVYKTELGKVYLLRYQKTEGDAQKMNLEKAESAFLEAVALKSDYPDAVAELALVYFYEGNKSQALETVSRASTLKKISVATAVQIGKIYYNLGKTTEAEEALKAAIRVSDKNSDAHYILGVIYKEAKRNSEALQEFKTVLQLNPGNQDVSGKISELEKDDDKINK